MTRLLNITLVVVIVALVTAGCDQGSPVVGAADASPMRAVLTPSQLDDITVPHGFTSEVFARGPFVDAVDAKFRVKIGKTDVVNVSNPSDMIVARVRIEEGGSVGWHSHPGPALVVVKAGTLGYLTEDCALRTYQAGQAFLDPGMGHVHIGYNAGSGELDLYVTYLGIPPGPALIPTQGPEC